METQANEALMSMPGIYSITNKLNGKRYIGSAVCMARRMDQHRRCLRGGRHHSSKLQNAFNRYGERAFVFEPMLVCKSDDLLMYEQRAIDLANPEYNIAKVAGSTLGLKWSDESRARHSKSRKGAGNPMFGRSQTGSTKLAIGNAQRAEKNHAYGKTLTEEHKAKAREKLKGRILSGDHRAKISKAKQGVPRPVHVIERMRAGAAEWAAKPESKAILSERSRKLWGSDDFRRKQSLARRRLSTEDVLRIRHLLSEGLMSQKQIGIEVGIAQCVVSHIKTGRAYADVQGSL